MRILKEPNLPMLKRWQRLRHLFVRDFPQAKIYLKDDRKLMK